MIGKTIKVISGKHSGKTGVIIGNLDSQNSWKVRQTPKTDGAAPVTFQVAKYYVVEVVKSPRVMAAHSTEEHFLGKWVEFDTGDAIETSRCGGIEAVDMRALVTDVWREEGRWLANVVFIGHYAVVPTTKLTIQFGQYQGGSQV